MGLPTLRPRIVLVDLRTAAPPPKVAEPFYSSGEWIALRDRVRREAGGRCQVAGCGRIERGMLGDHSVERKEGGAELERGSRRVKCRSHPTQKRNAARAESQAGRQRASRAG